MGMGIRKQQFLALYHTAFLPPTEEFEFLTVNTNQFDSGFHASICKPTVLSSHMLPSECQANFSSIVITHWEVQC